MINQENFPLTVKQIEILLYLYKFRFLTTHHIQKLLNHTSPQRTQAWLKDLLDKKYVKRIYSPKTFHDNTKPAIYYLAPLSRYVIHAKKEVNLSQLDYIYSEHRRKEKFTNHCLFIVDIYLYLLFQTDTTEELKFFTKVDLVGYDYFPDPIPDAYVSVKGEKKTRRYFLDFFDEYTPPWVARQRIRNYLEYIEKSDWKENTNDTPFPSILFILHNETIKNHIYKYSKAVLEKTFEEMPLFLTTVSKLQIENTDIWQKVE